MIGILCNNFLLKWGFFGHWWVVEVCWYSWISGHFRPKKVSICFFRRTFSFRQDLLINCVIILFQGRIKTMADYPLDSAWELLFVMSTILEEGLEPRPSMINVFIPNQHTDDETRVWDDTQPCDRGSGSIGGSVAERDTRWVQAKRVKPNNPRESEARPAPEEI